MFDNGKHPEDSNDRNDHDIDMGFSGSFNDSAENASEEQSPSSMSGVLMRLFEQFHDSAEEDSCSADHCHNNAVCAAKFGDMRKAVEICLSGLETYTNNVDLLADVIKYSSEMGDLSLAQEWYEKLVERVPRARWNWRAFTFTFDYLILNPERNATVCRELIADYHMYLPFEEKAYMAESEFAQAIGEHEHSMAILSEAINKLPNAPQCAVRLADQQLARGFFADVSHTAMYGLAASAEEQPSIKIPYLRYVKALADDALLHRKAAEGIEIPNKDIMCVHRAYMQLLDFFADELDSFSDNIKTRMKLLEMLNEEESNEGA